jgi:galactose-1-phosphate uridylyltransferase
MAVESRRGCGYRKVGGKYMVGGKLERACGLLPIELHVCPVCSSGIKQTRSWQWVVPGKLFKDVRCRQEMVDRVSFPDVQSSCILCPGKSVLQSMERTGLLWVGGAFYPEPEDFLREGAAQGVSRRVSAIPKGFKVGQTWVLIAHPKAVKREPRTDEERAELQAINDGLHADNIALATTITRKGIIAVFMPERIEQIVTQSQTLDAELMKDLEDKGITPVVVPDDDPDHQGRVYDKPDTKSAEMFDDTESTEE